MTRYQFPLLSIGLALPLAATAGAAPQSQVPPDVSRGAYAGLAGGLSLETPTTAGEITFKKPNDQTNPPAAWNPAVSTALPDYRQSVMFPTYGALVEIDAHSTGNAVFPQTAADGTLLMGQGARWMGIYISVTESSQGVPQSVINIRKTSGAGKVGADIYGHYVANSSGISPSLVDNTYLEQGFEHMGLPAGADIDAWDFPMAVRGFTPGLSRPLLFQHPNTTQGVHQYFFSVSVASAAVLPNFVKDRNSTATSAPHPASVYVMEWYNNQWHGPFEHFSYADMGFDKPGDNIDAIAVYAGPNRMLVSTQPSIYRSQILIYVPGNEPVTLLNPNGVPIECRFGLRSPFPCGGSSTPQNADDVDGLCDIDPEDDLWVNDNAIGISRENPLAAGMLPASLTLTRTRAGSLNAGTAYLQATGPNLPGTYFFFFCPDYVVNGGPNPNASWAMFSPRNGVRNGPSATTTIPIDPNYFLPGVGFYSVFVLDTWTIPGTIPAAVSPIVTMDIKQ